jgi:hypothetical protein
MSFSSPVDFSLLTALERELGRARVKAMAEAYLYSTMPPRAPAPLTPVLSPMSSGSPCLTPIRDPSKLGYTVEAWQQSCLTTPPHSGGEGRGFDLTLTPPPSRPTLMPPGAPARPRRPSSAAPEPDSPLPSLVVALAAAAAAAPPAEDDCARHSRIAQAGFGLRRSSNPPEGNGCNSCQREKAKKDGLDDIWALYCEADDDCDPEKIERGMRAIAIFHELYPEYDNMDLTNHILGRAERGFDRLMREYNS